MFNETLQRHDRQRSVSVRWRPPSTEEYRMRTGIARPAHLSVLESAANGGGDKQPVADIAELQTINFLHLNHNSNELQHSSSNSHEFS
uniref:Uncharacterized protein n=1 Tax=Anopheles stephensi TaxID=30069 RepID=A0A182XW41_ANOST